MRILLASSEVHPYSKTGGLADMVAALGKSLAELGQEITIITPLHRGIGDRFLKVHRDGADVTVDLAGRSVVAQIWECRVGPRERVLFVGQDDYFDRPNLYTNNGSDYPDNAERFIFFSKVVAALALREDPGFDVVHVHDWQTALVPLLIRHERERTGQGNGFRIGLTIHNLAYQGVFPAGNFGLTGLPPGWFNMELTEFYGQLNTLKAGIAAADFITTVSPRYAREITTEEFGCGLHGLLNHRASALHGILNGVDYEEWVTSSDNPYLTASYSPDDLKGKVANKLALQRELGLETAPDIPLFGSVTRLVDQKGVDLTLGALEDTVADNLQFVLLGSGDARYEQAFKDLASRHRDRVAVRIGYDPGLSHRIEAASDFYLMPSRFEPCGLNQLYSLRYGAIPIVRAIGGLDNSVIDINESEAEANGIKFFDTSVASLKHAIRKALAIYAEPDLLGHYRANGMNANFSSIQTAREYLTLYEHLT